MPVCRTVLSSTVMMASVRWRASPGRTSCRSRALVTSSTASSPPGTRWPRWPRRCWAPRSARWRSPTTAKMVSAAGCLSAWAQVVHTAHDMKPLQLCHFKNALCCWSSFSPSSKAIIMSWSLFPPWKTLWFVLPVYCTRQTHLQCWCKLLQCGINVWEVTFTMSNAAGTQWVIFSSESALSGAFCSSKSLSAPI